ncbi:uncharacterized protein EV420DRAFT_1768438 [Desarmillaria tabescens]|uniref:Uncharacterized protein n=1 Tax=Armillaria tabescens TaxID=1929756 RepID=A0AA39JKJ3_ARMTA|nr:uncharacterized protein EV420DRAFT_1768438 [Desarmillaria tabescens]KAK0443922.1 hypothetical protein EV420DRAFT_1768438 [Desarmillaria tabescens]
MDTVVKHGHTFGPDDLYVRQLEGLLKESSDGSAVLPLPTPPTHAPVSLYLTQQETGTREPSSDQVFFEANVTLSTIAYRLTAPYWQARVNSHASGFPHLIVTYLRVQSWPQKKRWSVHYGTFSFFEADKDLGLVLLNTSVTSKSQKRRPPPTTPFDVVVVRYSVPVVSMYTLILWYRCLSEGIMRSKELPLALTLQAGLHQVGVPEYSDSRGQHPTPVLRSSGIPGSSPPGKISKVSSQLQVKPQSNVKNIQSFWNNSVKLKIRNAAVNSGVDPRRYSIKGGVRLEIGLRLDRISPALANNKTTLQQMFDTPPTEAAGIRKR